jgi:hypothetical protein
MKEIEAERKANKPLTGKLADWLRSKFRRLDDEAVAGGFNDRS